MRGCRFSHVRGIAPFAALALALAALAVSGPAAAGKGPLLRLSEREVDFGRVDQFKQLKHEIVMRNEGDEPLRILKVETDCGCTAGVPSDSTIAPGGQEVLRLTFASKDYEGPQVKAVMLTTNDPGEPKLRIKLTADVHPAVRVEPPTLRFPPAVKGRTTSMSVRVAADKGAALKLAPIEGLGDYLEAVTAPDRSNPEEEAVSVELRVRPDAPPGFFHLTVRIPTTSPVETKLKVQASGTIVSYFVVAGEGRVNLPVAIAGESVKRELTIEADGSRPYRIVGVDSPLPYLKGIVGPAGANRWTLTVLLDETAPVKGIDEKLRIRTTDPAQPVIEIQVRGRVRGKLSAPPNRR